MAATDGVDPEAFAVQHVLYAVKGHTLTAACMELLPGCKHLVPGDVVFVCDLSCDNYAQTLSLAGVNVAIGFAGEDDTRDYMSILRYSGRPLGIVVSQTQETLADTSVTQSLAIAGNTFINNVWDSPQKGDVLGFVICNDKVVPWIFRDDESADYSAPMRFCVVLHEPDSENPRQVFVHLTAFDYCETDEEKKQAFVEECRLMDVPEHMPGPRQGNIKAATDSASPQGTQ